MVCRELFLDLRLSQPSPCHDCSITLPRKAVGIYFSPLASSITLDEADINPCGWVATTIIQAITPRISTQLLRCLKTCVLVFTSLASDLMFAKTTWCFASLDRKESKHVKLYRILRLAESLASYQTPTFDCHRPRQGTEAVVVQTTRDPEHSGRAIWTCMQTPAGKASLQLRFAGRVE